MREELRVLMTAVMFYTRIPCPSWVDHSEEYINKSIRYFPLIGWLVGGSSALFFWAGTTFISAGFGAVVCLVSGVLVTGAFHEDGLADTCDGFGGGWTKEKILQIMKDSRVGTYGVVGLVLLFLAKVLLLVEWKDVSISVLLFIFICAHAQSRWLAATMVFTHDYVRDADDSKAKPVSKSMNNRNLWVSSLFGLLPVLLLSIYLDNYFWLLTIPVGYLLKAALGRYFKKWIGGYTGDCLGATQQLTEVLFFVLAAILWKYT